MTLEFQLIPMMLVGPDVPEQISSLAMDGDAVWAASGPCVMKYHRGKEVNLPYACSARNLSNLGVTSYESASDRSVVYHDFWFTSPCPDRKRWKDAFLGYFRGR